MSKILITKQMKIDEVVKKHPETVEVFEGFGFHCVGCLGASFESIEDGAIVHEIDVDRLLEELNKVVEGKTYDQ